MTSTTEPLCRDGQGERCRWDQPAVVALVAPDGQRAPGVQMCAVHAEEVLDEYRQTLGEHWTTIPLDRGTP